MYLFFRYDIPDSGSVSGYGPVADRGSGDNRVGNMKLKKEIEDFEQGELWGQVKVPKKWWQFGVPKTIPYCYATYTKIGKLVQVCFPDGWSLTANEDQIVNLPR